LNRKIERGKIGTGSIKRKLDAAPKSTADGHQRLGAEKAHKWALGG